MADVTGDTGGAPTLIAADLADARALREQIRQAYSLGYVEGRDGRCYEIFPDSVTPERAAFLERACAAAAPEATLEIGMAWGMSTLGILSALAQGGRRFRPHVVIDPLQGARYRNAALLSIRRAGGEGLVEFHSKLSVVALPRLAGRVLDFAFVDGGHHYSNIFCDLWLLHPLLKPGALVVVDDVWFDDVQRACAFAEKYLGYRFHSEYPAGAGEQPLLKRVRCRPGYARRLEVWRQIPPGSFPSAGKASAVALSSYAAPDRAGFADHEKCEGRAILYPDPASESALTRATSRRCPAGSSAGAADPRQPALGIFSKFL